MPDNDLNAANTDPQTGTATASATENNDQTKTEKTGNDNGNVSGGLPHGVAKTLYELRQAKRESQAEIAALKEKLNSITSATGNKVIETPVDFNSDPDGYLKQLETKIKKEVEESVTSRIVAEKTQTEIQHKIREADKWITSQSEVQSNPESLEEMQEILQSDVEMQAVARVSPMTAMKLLLAKWKESKGIDDKSKAKASANASASASVKASSQTSGAKKIYTRAEVAAITKGIDYRTEEGKAKLRELEKAYTEGRIRG